MKEPGPLGPNILGSKLRTLKRTQGFLIRFLHDFGGSLVEVWYNGPQTLLSLVRPLHYECCALNPKP